MYELIILSVLVRRPAHGYVIGKIIGNIIGPLAKASNGRIYPLLAKLISEGYVSVSEDMQGGRVTRIYSITEAGRGRFRELVMDTSSNPKEYRESFAFKVSVFPLLEGDERRALLRHYESFCREHMAHLAAGIRDLSEDSSRLEADAEGGDALRRVLEHNLAQWRLELEWLGELGVMYP